jgi:hypothetical protein
MIVAWMWFYVLLGLLMRPDTGKFTNDCSFYQIDNTGELRFILFLFFLLFHCFILNLQQHGPTTHVHKHSLSHTNTPHGCTHTHTRCMLVFEWLCICMLVRKQTWFTSFSSANSVATALLLRLRLWLLCSPAPATQIGACKPSGQSHRYDASPLCLIRRFWRSQGQFKINIWMYFLSCVSRLWCSPARFRDASSLPLKSLLRAVANSTRPTNMWSRSTGSMDTDSRESIEPTIDNDLAHVCTYHRPVGR